MKTLTFFHKLLSTVLIVSFGISPLSVFAQEVAEIPAATEASTAAAETTSEAPTPTVDTPVSTVEEIMAPADESADSPLPIEQEQVPEAEEEEKSEEPTPTEDPKPTEEPEPNGLLDSSEYPYEAHRQPVNTNVHINAEESSGALTLSYPIKTPPGRNGIEPSLSLNYNSRSQENVNVAGFGWSVDIPYIERFNRKGSETLYSDFYFRSSWDDELASSSATNTELYSANVENGAFRKYEYKSQQWWKVTDKNGTVYTFGTSTNTRLDDPNNSARVYRWMLEKIEDTNGNSITYSYTKDRGQIYPYKVNYTRSATDEGIFEVEFLTESRSDVATSTASGFAVVSRYRINEIQAKVNSSWVRKYSLAYTTGENGVRSLLSTVTETGRDELSGTSLALPPTQFVYGTSTKSWTQNQNYSTSSLPHFSNWLNLDLGVRITDVNGDGLSDLLQLKGENTVDFKRVFINNGNGTGWTENLNYSTTSLPLFITSSGIDTGLRVADVNGDGFPDLIESKESGSRNVFINNGNGTGWTEDTTYVEDFPYFVSSTGLDYGIRIVDVNGDGLPDMVKSKEENPSHDRHVYINKGTEKKWVEDTNYVTNYPVFVDSSGDTGVRIADINSDGYLDLIKSFQHEASNIIKEVYINNADGTGWTQNYTYASTSYPIFTDDVVRVDYGVRLADLNGEGLEDIIKSFSDDTELIFTKQALN